MLACAHESPVCHGVFGSSHCRESDRVGSGVDHARCGRTGPRLRLSV